MGTPDVLRLVTAATTTALLATLAAACAARDDWAPEALLLGDVSVSRHEIERGRQVYAEYCVGCHGARGDGRGPAARMLEPPPRDFTKGIFKFAGVPSGTLPHDEDLERIIARGLFPSAMPDFPLLDAADRRAVVQYLKTFSPRWASSRPGARIVPTDDPFADDDAGGIQRGRHLYHGIAECWSCHPSYASRAEISAFARTDGRTVDSFRDAMFAPVPKPSDWGFDIVPPDFPVEGVKSGSSLEDLYRTIASGVGGTAMPTWRESLPENDIWALVHYVRSLVVMDRATLARLRRTIGAPAHSTAAVSAPPGARPDLTPPSPHERGELAENP